MAPAMLAAQATALVLPKERELAMAQALPVDRQQAVRLVQGSRLEIALLAQARLLVRR